MKQIKYTRWAKNYIRQNQSRPYLLSTGCGSSIWSLHTAALCMEQTGSVIPEWLKWTCRRCICSEAALCLSQKGEAGSDFILIRSCDLTMTSWPLYTILNIHEDVPAYQKNGISRSRLSKIRALQCKQTQIGTKATERITAPGMWFRYTRFLACTYEVCCPFLQKVVSL